MNCPICKEGELFWDSGISILNSNTTTKRCNKCNKQYIIVNGKIKNEKHWRDKSQDYFEHKKKMKKNNFQINKKIILIQKEIDKIQKESKNIFGILKYFPKTPDIIINELEYEIMFLEDKKMGEYNPY